MAINKKKALVVGGVVLGGYLLLKYLSKPKPAPLGFWPFDSDKDLAIKAQAEAQKLYDELQNLVVGIPAEYATLPSSQIKAFSEIVTRYKGDYIDGAAKALAVGDVKMAKYYSDALITDAPRVIVWVKEFLASAPEALAAQKRGENAALVIKMSNAARTAELQEEQRKAADKVASAETFIAATKPVEDALKLAGKPFGITGEPGKGFFDNINDMISRIKWYAIGAAGIYVAIKFGPSLMKWAGTAKHPESAHQEV